MSRALRLSLSIAALIGLTLGPKLVAASRTAEADDIRLARDMAAMLSAQGFSAVVVPHHLFGHVRARKGNCTLVATNMPAAGHLRDRFAEETAAIGPALYHYGNGPPAAFPRLVPVIAEHLQNWAYRIGLDLPRVPVIAIAASPACRLESLDWAAMRVWPRPLGSGR